MEDGDVAAEDEEGELQGIGDDDPAVAGVESGGGVEDPVGGGEGVGVGREEDDVELAGLRGRVGLVGVAGDVADVAGDGLLTLPVEDLDVAVSRVDGAVGGGGAGAVVLEGVEDDGVGVDVVPAAEEGRDVEAGDGGGPVAVLEVGVLVAVLVVLHHDGFEVVILGVGEDSDEDDEGNEEDELEHFWWVFVFS